MSGRLVLSIAHRHLRGQARHGQRCTEERCVSGCGFLAIEEWLDAPVTKSDLVADGRRKQRLTALMRGEIPA